MRYYKVEVWFFEAFNYFEYLTDEEISKMIYDYLESEHLINAEEITKEEYDEAKRGEAPKPEG